ALGFAGGFPGDFIAQTLKDSDIHTDFVQVDEDTRINVKLKTGQETEVNAQGHNVTDAKFQSLLNQIKETTDNDTVIVAGSVPK
ncbi:PfkB family carbohydrate kinase, partial [Staphylococcus epidermidis]|uniref:PfkB family carbohydrate kinase n=1 Tax=Staphylococcus epidermidis TaxID=1282 RepID=UPI0030BF6751